MQIRNRQFIQEMIGFQKQLIGFTGKAHNDIHSYTGIGHVLANGCHSIHINLTQIAAFHFFQNHVTTRLEGNVKMRHKSLALRYKRDGFVAQQIGLDRRNAQAFNSVNFVKRLHQIQKSMFVFFVAKFTFAVIANIYSSEHNFFNALRRNFEGILQHIF